MAGGRTVLDLIFRGFAGRGGGFGGFDSVLYGTSLLHMVNICTLCTRTLFLFLTGFKCTNNIFV